MPDNKPLTRYITWPWAAVTEIGLEVTSMSALAQSFEMYEQNILYLLNMDNASQWSLGDAYIAGTIAFRKIDPTQAFPNTKAKIKTLQNYAWVCRRYKFSERNPSVSFSHHAVVAKLPQHRRVYYLNEVIENDWTVEDLDEESREERGNIRGNDPNAYWRICEYYNDMVREYESLPEAPEKSLIRHGLKVLENAIKRSEAAFNINKKAA